MEMSKEQEFSFKVLVVATVLYCRFENLSMDGVIEQAMTIVKSVDEAIQGGTV
jgi:hypothetical protein